MRGRMQGMMRDRKKLETQGKQRWPGIGMKAILRCLLQPECRVQLPGGFVLPLPVEELHHFPEPLGHYW